MSVAKAATTKKRSVYIDILKGVAIILVVIGHCFQHGLGHVYIDNNEALLWANPVEQFIYSFHMPLFMLISGYLFWGSSERRSAMDNLKNKCLRVLVPILSWGAVAYVAKLVLGQVSLSAGLVGYFQYILTQNWFLWAIALATVVTLVGKNLFKDSVFFFVGVTIIVIFTPSEGILPLCTFVLPYFGIGYLYAKYRAGILEKFPLLGDTKGRIKILLALVVVFVILFLFYDAQKLIYTTGLWVFTDNPLSQLGIDIYRFVIGLVGSCAFFMLLRVVVPDVSANEIENGIAKRTVGIITWLGKNTLGIYVFSNIFMFNVMRPLLMPYDPNFLLLVPEVIGVLAISSLVVWLLSLCKPLRMLFLGAAK